MLTCLAHAPLSPRSDGIVRWVKKKTGPAAADVADKDALTAAEKGAEVLAIGFFKELKVGARGCAVWLVLTAAALRHDRAHAHTLL